MTVLRLCLIQRAHMKVTRRLGLVSEYEGPKNQALLQDGPYQSTLSKCTSFWGRLALTLTYIIPLCNRTVLLQCD